MKKLLVALLVFGFSEELIGQIDLQENPVKTSEKQIEDINFVQLYKLFVVGNFDGNGIDTLSLHHYSNLTKTEIDSFPCPSNLDDWGDFINCFYNQDIISYLSFNTKNKDTFHFGNLIGLYCLINIGDNNLDGKDEIALVEELLDYSRLNYCYIFTLCNNEWTMLKEFAIHEDAFTYYKDEMSAPHVFSEVKEFLEKHDGKWFYLDYLKDGWDSIEEVGKMELLELENCIVN